MKSTRISSIVNFLLVVVIAAGLLGIPLVPASANAAYFIATEMWDNFNVQFTVNTDYNDILEFAVANNDASQVSIDFNATNPPPDGWYGKVAENTVGGWIMWYDSSQRSLVWLDSVTVFDDYDYAFLYSC